MQKAFDTQELIQRAKASLPGIEHFTEEQIIALLDIVTKWIEDSVALTPNPFDDVAVAALKAPIASLKEAVKKIDIDGDGQ